MASALEYLPAQGKNEIRERELVLIETALR